MLNFACLKTRVAMQRIETFLNEDEVDEQVSTIKRQVLSASGSGLNSEANEFGLHKASFKWNSVEDKDKKSSSKMDMTTRKWWNFTKRKPPSKNGKDTSPPSPTDLEAALSTAQNESDVQEDHIFELHDLSIVFPERQLTLVTGPTASGKTALLVRTLVLLSSIRMVMLKLLSAGCHGRDDTYSGWDRKDFAS